jgi:hypothetical protein
MSHFFPEPTEQVPMIRLEIEAILEKCMYDKPTWTWRLLEKGDGFLFQWEFMEKDLTDPSSTKESKQQARKHYISPYMTTSEVVRTVYVAVVQAEMHEIQERFTFLGKRIFDPHMDYVHLAYELHHIGVDNRIPKK